MEFLEKNWKLISGGVIAILGVGLIVMLINLQSSKKETEAQNKFAPIENEYSQYKDELSKIENAQKANSKDSKAPDITALIKTKEKLSADLLSFIDQHPQTVASEMAALYASEIMTTEGKTEEALGVLKKVSSTGTRLSSVLVTKKTAALLADQDKCNEALPLLNKIVSVSFVSSDVKILQALCHQKLNDLDKATEILTSIKNDKTGTNAESVKEADKILRLIKFKKTSGT